MISIEAGFQFLEQHIAPQAPQPVELMQSIGRVLATSVAADLDSPPHRKSVMDGYAVRSEDIAQGNKRLKVIETIVAGDWPKRAIEPGESSRIMTGAPIPDGADAVVMVELTRSQTDQGQEWVSIEADNIPPGKHAMNQGDNFRAGDVLFETGHRIRPIDVGLLAEIGAHQPLVGWPPSIAVLPTGDELVDANQKPGLGQIRNSNGPMVNALAESLGAALTSFAPGRDDREDLQTKIRSGLAHDFLVLTGGVSAGIRDLVPAILRDEGVEEIFHHVKIKPGKPIWFGKLNCDDKECFVFGLPGNPVSSLVGFHLFVRSAIRIFEGDPNWRPNSVPAELKTDHETRGDRPTYWPGRWDSDATSTRRVEPLVWHGSSDLRALGLADGLIYFDGTENDHLAGKQVDFYPFQD